LKTVNRLGLGNVVEVLSLATCQWWFDGCCITW